MPGGGAPLPAAARCRRQSRSLIVACIDLDGFKTINDAYGHAIGDRFLAAMARHLGAATRAGDTLARFGGDDFTALLVDFADIRDGLPALERLQVSAAHLVRIGGLTLQVTASIGIAAFPDELATPEELIAEAARAMYVAKRTGKNCVRGHGLSAWREGGNGLSTPARCAAGLPAWRGFYCRMPVSPHPTAPITDSAATVTRSAPVRNANLEKAGFVFMTPSPVLSAKRIRTHLCLFPCADVA